MIAATIFLSLFILQDPPARPDLESWALTLDIALEDAGPCEAELRAADRDGPRCGAFLLAYREAVIGQVEVDNWILAGRPGAVEGDAARLEVLLGAHEELARQGDRILRRFEILAGDPG